MNEILNDIIVYVVTGSLGFVAVFVFRINSALAVIKNSLDDLKEDKKVINDKIDKLESRVNQFQIEVELIKQNCKFHEKNN